MRTRNVYIKSYSRGTNSQRSQTPSNNGAGGGFIEPQKNTKNGE